ncbi:hypothetical protein LWI29_029544 [Acer saccharum]|uniref:Uncharacterized protein n=1 Tax=Acer saccharum TaxID=4024 RepID=A0AA39RRG9_ACESA|nr:hypothetical protein LWI29_029544 [Acer saccharum]
MSVTKSGQPKIMLRPLRLGKDSKSQGATTREIAIPYLMPKQAVAATLTTDYVAKTLVGTAVYTVSNSNNEFVLISDPNGAKSIGLLCFRQEDAEAFLAQVRLRKRELRGQAKVVPITLDQVIDDIRSWLGSFSLATVEFRSRSSNSFADTLAKKGLSPGVEDLWWSV